MSEQPSLRERVAVPIHAECPWGKASAFAPASSCEGCLLIAEAVLVELHQHITEGLDEALRSTYDSYPTDLGMSPRRFCAALTFLGLLPSPECPECRGTGWGTGANGLPSVAETCATCGGSGRLGLPSPEQEQSG